MDQGLIKIIQSGRAPLIHLIVIYRLNKRAVEYTEHISQVFIKAGIDVYLQQSINGRTITPEDISGILVASPGDYTAVVGIRDAVNQTLHLKKSGRLVGKKVNKTIQYIHRHWRIADLPQIDKLSPSDLEKLSALYTHLRYPKNNDPELLRKLAEEQSKLTELTDPYSGEIIDLEKGRRPPKTISPMLKRRLQEYTNSRVTLQIQEKQFSWVEKKKDPEKGKCLKEVQWNLCAFQSAKITEPRQYTLF